MDLASVEPRGLPFHLLEEITNNFSEERIIGSGGYGKVYMGVLKDGKRIAVKLLHPMRGFEDNEQQFKNELNNLVKLQHQNIVQLVGYCYDIQKQYKEYNGRYIFAETIRRALCFEYMPNGSLENYLSDEYTGHDWHTRYAIIKGICNGLKYLHEELEYPIYHLDLKPANVLLDENMEPKIADFGLSRIFGEEHTQITNTTIGTFGYLPPEYLERSVISNKFDIFSLGVVIIKIMTGPMGYSKSAEMLSHQFTELVHAKWRSRLQASSVYAMESYSEQVKTCIELALRCVEADRHKRPSIGSIVNMLTETEAIIQFHCALRIDPRSSMDQMSPDTCPESELLEVSQKKETEFLDVYPSQLHFPFEPNKWISCPLRITNNTDDHFVAFRCLPETPEYYLDGLFSLHGILPPRSTCTYVVTMEMQKNAPENMDMLAVILESCIVQEGMTSSDVDDYLFLSVREESGSKVHEVTLMAVFDPAGEMMNSEPIWPRIKIMYCRDSLGLVVSMDVHPTEPWILAGHHDGYVSVWNYQTQSRVTALRIANGKHGHAPLIRSIKFIARQQCFVGGDGNGYIHVRRCLSMDALKKFKAHTAWIKSLAVHPSLPFVLSASDDHLIKLWNWETGWACIRTFEGHTGDPENIMFSPQNAKTFASVALDSTVKIWSISSDIPIATLDCNGDEQLCVDFFSPGGDRQYIVTGSRTGTARIWDLETETCIRELEGLQGHCGCNFSVVDSLRDSPILITALPDFAVSLCNTTTYRHEDKVDFMLGRVRGGFAYIKGIKSVVIGFDDGMAIMEIN